MSRIVSLTRTCGFQIFGRHATPNLMRWNLGILQHQRSCCHNGSLAYLATVEQGGTHTYERPIVNGAGMNGDIMTNGYVATNMSGTRLVCHMNTRTILNVGSVANGYGSHIAPHHSIEPY